MRRLYTLKKRLVEAFGEEIYFENRRYYLFPKPRALAQINVADLRALQFTWKKSEYIIELAQKMVTGELTEKRLLAHAEFETARKELMQLHGIGRWTADYVSLRCLKDPAALPVADVGLQNAVKQQLGLSKKPTAEDMAGYSKGWNNWQAYACFYLWASLI
ncbi:DNA-3-methyladenine glycosylase II (EC [Olavius algarvensis Delta 1 endosymbiont]|nr:DNA-3-methyladenine glycosylase II (EC [Olavius algarvensis Delta 1 endosymbiont]